MSKRWAVLILQILITLGIFAALTGRLNFDQVIRDIHHIRPEYLVAALAVLAVQVIVVAFRWVQLLKMAEISFPLGRIIGAFAAGSFLNSVIPGGVSGDAMRAWYVTRGGAGTSTAINSVILDRLAGFIGLGVLVLIAVFGRWAMSGAVPPVIDLIAAAISCGVIIVTLALVCIEPVIHRFSMRWPFLSPLRNLLRALHILKNHDRLFLFIATVIGGPLMQMAAILILSWGLQVPLSPAEALIGLPTALLLSALPITPGGWGLREGAMVLILGRFGIAAEDALSISVLFGIASICANLPGALFWFTHRREVKTAPMAEELPT